MKDQKPAPKPRDIEELPDAWERFEKAFDTVMKATPKPRSAVPTPKPKERPASKGRVHKGKDRSLKWPRRQSLKNLAIGLFLS
jgi:hypothetical protein